MVPAFFTKNINGCSAIKSAILDRGAANPGRNITISEKIIINVCFTSTL